MKTAEIKKALQSKGPIPPEVLQLSATVLVEIIKALFEGRKNLRERVQLLEGICKLQAEQLAKIEKQLAL